MKFLNAVTAGLVPMVAAKSMRAKRDGHLKSGALANSVSISKAQLAALGLSGAGIQSNALTQVIIVWFNQGAGVPTTVVNQQQTVTQTVTVGGGGGNNAALPPPPPPTGAPGVAPPPPANNAPPAAPPAGAPPVATGPPGSTPTHLIKVGGPKGLVFEPAEIKAAIGDMVIFEFYSANHTATQSTFELPCDPLAGGMDTGHQANIQNAVVPAPQVAMQVMVDTPLWFYCKTGNHCGNGMVFSINPTAAKTHAQFQGEAIKQKGNGVGGAITGNGGQAPPAAPPAGAPPVAAPAGGNNSTLPPVNAPPALNPLPGTAPTNTVANGAIGTAPALPGVVPGVGTVNPDGSCSCVVMCGSGQFPSIQLQGGGSFGGVAGAVPAAGVVRR